MSSFLSSLSQSPTPTPQALGRGRLSPRIVKLQRHNLLSRTSPFQCLKCCYIFSAKTATSNIVNHFVRGRCKKLTDPLPEFFFQVPPRSCPLNPVSVLALSLALCSRVHVLYLIIFRKKMLIRLASLCLDSIAPLEFALSRRPVTTLLHSGLRTRPSLSASRNLKAFVDF